MITVENAAWAVVNELLASIQQYDQIGPSYTLSCGTECFDASVLLDRREILKELRDALLQSSLSSNHSGQPRHQAEPVWYDERDKGSPSND